MVERFNAYIIITKGKNKGKWEHPVITGTFRAESYTQAKDYAYYKLGNNTKRKRWGKNIVVERVRD